MIRVFTLGLITLSLLGSVFIPEVRAQEHDNQVEGEASASSNSGENNAMESGDGELPDYERIKDRFPDVPFFFFSRTGVRIDVEIKKSNVRLQSAELWLTEDFGKTWNKPLDARDGQDNNRWFIDYDFPKEGLYGIQTTGTDVAGNKMDPPSSGDRPAMFIYIDQSRPEVGFGSPEDQRFFPPTTESVTVNWNVSDPILEPESVRVSVSYDRGKSWNKLVEGKPVVKKREVPFDGNDTLLFQVSARDRAGNRIVFQTDRPFRRAKNWAHYRSQRKSGWPSPPFASKSRNVIVNYSLPTPKSPGKTSKNVQIMLYYTTDGGRSWKRADVKRIKKREAIRFHAPDDGFYGFYLNFSYPNSSAYRPYPKTGTRPDSRTLIDTKKPSVDLISPKAREKLEAGDRVNIIYKAYDTYFPDHPVSLFYSTNGGENWKLIKRDLASEGLYNWKVPEEPTSDLRLKVEARDMAGHVSRDISPEPLYIPGDPEKSPARIHKVVATSITEDKSNEKEKESEKKEENGEEVAEKDEVEKDEDDREKEMEEEEGTEDEKTDIARKIRTWMKKAAKFKRRRQFQKAGELYRNVLRHRPDHVDALEGLGLCLYKISKYSESETVFRKLIALSEKNERTYLFYNLGCTLYMQEKFEESADQLKRALDRGLARKYKETDAAKIAYEKLLEIARQFLKENRKEKALNYLKNLKRRNLKGFPEIKKSLEELLDKYST